MAEPTFEPLFGTSVLDLRYMAFGPRGQVRPWPRSKWKRAWLRLHGWVFVEDSAIETQRRLNWLRSVHYEITVQKLSRDEIEQRYGRAP